MNTTVRVKIMEAAVLFLLVALVAVSSRYYELASRSSSGRLLDRIHAMESKYAAAESYCEAHIQCRRSR